MSLSSESVVMNTNALKMIPEPLNALTFPLFGKRLIEASAGTGKTYTIANLYLRLLVPTGPHLSVNNGDLDKPLTVDQILVVTFTEAATAELKARIRGRIRAARKALLQGESRDVFLADWLAQMSGEQRAGAIEKLLYAEKQMDEAAVFTIHGFCQRMLSQNAFESRMLFQQTIETDELAPLSMAVKDVWRSVFYPMDDTKAALIQPIWSNPDALLKDLYLLNNQPDAKIAVPDYDWENALSQAQETMVAVRAMWLAQSQDIIDALECSGIKRTFWRKDPSKDIEAMTQWANSTRFELDKSLEKFDTNEHASRLSKGGDLPAHEFFALVQALRESFPDAGRLKAVLLTQLWQQTQERMKRWKRSTQSLTFTDLLTSLDVALTQDEAGKLAERIRHLYPIALIDEFQDTDAVQYRIFSTIYAPAKEHQNALGLIMIGDPKQAIYAFRGADIYTYLAAKKRVDSVHSLATNYRSSAAMIQSVNGLFTTQAEPFRVTGIPFAEVQDRGVASGFSRQGQTQAALQFLYQRSDEPVSAKEYRQTMAESCAAHLHALLLEGQGLEGQQGIALIDGQGVRPKDVALLVTNFSQANALKDALRQRGIASVYLSDKGSVFETVEARELLIVLTAILFNGQESKLRSALATSLVDWSLEALDTLNHDDVVYEKWVQAFRDYLELWDKQGLLPMLREFMQDVALAANMLSHTGGERRLTDFLHLTEKLQQKSLELDSKEGVLRYLRLAIQNPNGNSDEQKIRLETDAELVRIVTIHKSKGLEYPIVYLPFAFTPYRDQDKSALYHDAQQQLWIAIDPDEAQTEQHKEELYAAEIRLAYVALTRSKEACFIGTMEVGKKSNKTRGAVLDVHLSGVGALIGEGEPIEAGDLYASIERLCERYQNAQMCLLELPDEPPRLPRFKMTAFNQGQEELIEPSARDFTGRVERDWWVGSYSSLVVEDKEHHDESVPGLDEMTRFVDPLLDDVEVPASLLEVQQKEPEKNRFTFPKGAKPGTFLHDTLEGKALQSVSANPSFKDLLKNSYHQLMADFYQRQGFDEWQEVLSEWLPDIVNTELMAGMSLGGLAPSACRKEMEFFIPVTGMNALRLDRISREYDEVSRVAPMIQDRPLKGMLKGFIDLLFEYQGRYYVLDYKSNYLGDDFADYQPDKLVHAIAEHRYDLQYQLYTLALHRLLKQRLPNYDYGKHVGGVVYLFLRGMQPTQQTGIFQSRLTLEHVTALDKLFSGESDKPKNHEAVQYGLF
ncbi:exodeoxyribonuclease V subunit beta [Marinomonas sp. M1K-6]|uniref:RecBCD enzyme subunit RecB n=1 Tax=Marinomonas profundi TaxID=2726122 RepID=A0A847R6J9_9GAMM|nr:exodeoxyribonuclease V subunit beta [Marinomonas profundi]NLQ16717.1 exodeoxyribonuclease V subunit beta [Marinomonas profundi]UDV03707.1 exodeoxyribonuclease V subunit beta [Marinomonas profundi]